MEIRQLRYFARIVEMGGFTSAARSLNVAQPALSQQIANLEAELGQRLLERLPTGAVPTAPGEALFGHAQSIMRQIEQARLEIAEFGDMPRGRAVIGLPMSTAAELALPLMRLLRSEYPGIVLQLMEGPNNLLLEMLSTQRIEAAVLYGANFGEGLRPIATFKEPLYLIESGHMPKTPIVLAEALTRGLILPPPEAPLRILVESAAQNSGSTLQIVSEMHSVGTIKSAVAAGLASTLLSAGTVSAEIDRGELVARSIISPPLTRTFSIVVPARSTMATPAQKVIELLIAELEDICEKIE